MGASLYGAGSRCRIKGHSFDTDKPAMLNPMLRLAELLYRQPSERSLQNEERRRELQAYYGLFFIFLVLPFGLATYLAMGAVGDPELTDFLPLPPFLLGLLFFVLWIRAKEKVESFYLSLFAMVTCVLQLRFTAAYPREFNAADTASFDVFMLAVQGGFGLLLAMAFARARALVFQLGLPLLVGLPVMAQPLLRFFEFNLSLAGFMSTFYVPACFLLGALACVLQAIALRVHMPEAKGRWLRVNLFALGMGALFVASLIEAKWWEFGPQTDHLRLLEGAVLLYLSVLGLLEYGPPRAGQKGFTLIELMIVVGVIGMLAALASPMYERYQAASRQAEAKLVLSSIFVSEKSFYAEYTAYVSSFDALSYLPEGHKRFYTVGWSAPMAGTVSNYHGSYGTPVHARLNVPATFGCDIATATAALPPPVGTDQHSFMAGAAGGIRIGLDCDVWTIDSDKVLSNSVRAL